MNARYLLACLLPATAWAAPALDVPPDLPYAPALAGGVAHRQADGGAFLLRTSYELPTWSGDVERIDIAAGEKARELAWRAAARLPAHGGRNIYTTVQQGAGVATVPFKHGSLPPGLFGEALVNYLRGDRSREGHGLRIRSSALGAVVRSEPLLVGPPSSGDGPGYTAFCSQHRLRPTLAYVTANDGMLHAFGIEDGIERLGYIPRRLLPTLGALASNDYVRAAHLDASPGVGDARVRGQWRTVLASGYGMGARGLFAVDVTDPGHFGAGAGELWQFTEQDDALVGHIHARPVIAKFRVGGTAAAPAYRDFVVVSSGINNYGDDDAPDGALYLLGLDKDAAAPWKHGVDYFRLLAPAAQAQRANVLGPPALVRGPDGAVRLAYAGDLQGNLWRFDFTGGPPWPAQGTLLFTARAGGARQPITAAPAVAHAAGGYLVLFGTGRVMEKGDFDQGASGTQSFYAVYDALAKAGVGGAKPIARDDMAKRTLWQRDGLFEVEGPDIDYAVHKGWYFDFPQSAHTGERGITTPPLAGGIVVVRSLLPPDEPSATPSERTYVLDALTGLSAEQAGTVAAAPTGRKTSHPSAFPAPLVMSYVPGRADGSGAVRAAIRFSFIPLDGGPAPLPVSASTPAGRLSWREIPNWQELHEASE